MTTEIIIQAARTAEAAGQVRQAVGLCQQALQLDAQCLPALLMLGSICARHGRVDEAEGLLRRAIAVDPESYDAVRWITTLLIGRNGGGNAVEFGQRLVQLRPEEAETHVVLGLAALGNGNTSLAILSLQRAIELNPQMSGAYHNLGVVFQREDAFDEAIQAFERAAELSPTVLETWLHLAGCYLAEDRGDDALACANKALELNPNSLSAKQLLADARYVAFQGEQGLDHIKGAIAEDPIAAFPQALMASRLQEQGDFSGADIYTRRSIELNPNQGFAYYTWAHNGKIGEDQRAFVEGAETVASHASLEPEERQYLHFGLGKAYDDLGDYERAIHHFDMAHTQDPEAPNSPVSPKGASWVHRLTDLFSAEVLARFEHLAMETDEPIFVFGMPRSGTTLLEQIVSSHSTVGAAGELFFWRDKCHRVVNLSQSAVNPSELQSAGSRYLDLIRSKAPGKAHVTDKFPSNYLYLGFLHLIYPKAIFIHAKRHPLDVCLSNYMRPFSTNTGLGRTREDIVQSYKLYLEAMNHWHAVLPSGRIFDVDYEQLVQSPEEATRAVIKHCRLAWDDACLRPHESDRRVVTFSKWQVRQPVYTTSVERWRHYEPWLGIFRELLPER